MTSTLASVVCLPFHFLCRPSALSVSFPSIVGEHRQYNHSFVPLSSGFFLFPSGFLRSMHHLVLLRCAPKGVPPGLSSLLPLPLPSPRFRGLGVTVSGTPAPASSPASAVSGGACSRTGHQTQGTPRCGLQFRPATASPTRLLFCSQVPCGRTPSETDVLRDLATRYAW